MNKYSYTVRWSDEDECYVALCPEFPGLSGLGDTPDDAFAELQVAQAMAIETYQEEGWPLPEPSVQPTYSGKFLVRLPKSLHAQLAEQADTEGVSLNMYVVSRLSEVSGLTRIQSLLQQYLHFRFH